MCLKIKYKEEPLVTKKPIKCYKVFLVFSYESHKTQIFSPMYRYQYGFNRMACTDMFVDHLRSENVSVVFEGFHSFVNKRDAIKFAEEIKKLNEYAQKGFYDYKVMECIIPANSKCYKGTFSLAKDNDDFNDTVKNLPAYASNKIIPKRFIKTNNHEKKLRQQNTKAGKVGMFPITSDI